MKRPLWFIFGLAILVIMTIKCCSPGNAIREQVNEKCSSINLPREAIVDPRSIITVRTDKFMPVDPYNYLGDHAYRLRVCAESLECAIQWTEWERDCQASKTIMDSFFGRDCKLKKPACRI
jgi:hypothetical protein